MKPAPDIKGYTVEKVLVAEGIQFNSEFYVGLTIDRNTKSVIFMASAKGGVEIEVFADSKSTSSSLISLCHVRSWKADYKTVKPAYVI